MAKWRGALGVAKQALSQQQGKFVDTNTIETITTENLPPDTSDNINIDKIETETIESKTVDGGNTEIAETENVDGENVKAKKNWRQKLSSPKKIREGKRLWRRVNNIANRIENPLQPNNFETFMYFALTIFGILVILTVAFLYALGLLLEVGGWLGSVIETVTFFVNEFSKALFRESLKH